MTNPVLNRLDNITYERTAITEQLKGKSLSMQIPEVLVSNRLIGKIIGEYSNQNKMTLK